MCRQSPGCGIPHFNAFGPASTFDGLPTRTEVQLRFQLPETRTEVAPTAQVIWQRTRPHGGVGMRFLSLDGRALRTLDDYIFERIRPASSAGRGGLLA